MHVAKILLVSLSPCLPVSFSLPLSLCVSVPLWQMAIFFEKFLHNVRKSPVRIKLRISFQALFQLAIGPSPCPREEMRQFEIYFRHLIRSGMLYAKTCNRMRFSILLYWLSSQSSLLAPQVPAQVPASINGEISRFLFNEILEILML
jgi:hypothetical protein